MSDISYQTVLTDHGLRAHAATDEEKSLATEVAQLRALLADGDCAHDMRTLRNVQEQRRRVVARAMAVVDRPHDAEAAAAMVSAVRELRRIAGRCA